MPCKHPCVQTKDQLAGGVEYLKKLNDKSPDWSDFEVASGIGIEVGLFFCLCLKTSTRQEQVSYSNY